MNELKQKIYEEQVRAYARKVDQYHDRVKDYHMKICCDKFKEFSDEGEVLTATDTGKVFLTQYIPGDDDGDGHIDGTIGIFEPINFCPFCGNKFSIQKD